MKRDIEATWTPQPSPPLGSVMRKALVVGIDYYEHVPPLFGCTNDARAVAHMRERNADANVNFDVRLLIGTAPVGVRRREIRDSIRNLFASGSEVALLYFAGHGHIEETGGYILSSDSASGEEGIPLNEILVFANQSRAENRIIILDSCHSGTAGAAADTNQAELSEGITILTASGADQYATEHNGAGLFTTLLVDALGGAASNLVGQITPGAVYAHIDQSLGAWEQRPVFKTNVKRFVSLRQVAPPIDLVELRMLSDLFPAPGYEFKLEPSFEPEGPEPNPANMHTFRILQKYNRVNLLVPVGASHMYHAAMASKSCRLTALGEHYRRLCERRRI
jgi:Caspase domain